MPTYQEIYNSVDEDGGTRARIAVAAAKYALYLLATGSASQSRQDWANATLADARAEATRLMWAIAGDAQYLVDGPSISDANLQTAVETAVNNKTPEA